MSSKYCIILASVLALFQSHVSVFAEEVIELPALIKEGTPGEVLLSDSIVPAIQGTFMDSSGSGSIQNQIQDQAAIPISNYGRPGNLGQVRGLGFSAEEVDVQAFGVSLNPPVGGGFDLSTFPQFLWSSYQYQSGPSLNALNPTASSGTLSLVPWTSKAITQPGWGGRGTEFYSDFGLNQISGGMKDGEHFALIAGYSSLKAVGPSGGFSTQWKNGGYTGSLHLIASDIDAESIGPSYFPAPNARTRNTRIIPILLNDFQVGRSALLKTSVFYDYSNLKYTDPDQSSFYKSQTQQFGAQNVLYLDEWKVGVSARRIDYFSDSSYSGRSEVPSQATANLQLSRELEVFDSLLEPTVQGVWVTGYGLLPQGSLGLRKEWDRGQESIYSRTTVSHRVPSLMDRFYTSSYFSGNPNLKTELDWTETVGGDLKRDDFEIGLQGYGQYRQDARVNLITTVTNLGDAFVMGLNGNGKVKLGPNLDLFDSVMLARSKLLLTGEEFPYVPRWIQILGVTAHPAGGVGDSRSWEWNGVMRTVSSQLYSPTTDQRLGSYTVFDTWLQILLLKQYSAMIRVENLFDRPIEMVRGYPIGRIVSMSFSAQI